MKHEINFITSFVYCFKTITKICSQKISRIFD